MNQLLVMQYLIYGEVCVRDAGADDEWTMGGQRVGSEMLLDGLEEAKLSGLLVLGEICGFILGEECREEEGAPCENTSLSSRHIPVPYGNRGSHAPRSAAISSKRILTIYHDITDDIRKIFLLLSLAIVSPKNPREMSQYCITLR